MNLESIIAPAKERASELESEIDRVKREVMAPMQEELRALTRVIKASEPQTKPGRKPTSPLVGGNRTAKAAGRSPVRYGVVTNAVLLELLKREPGDEFRGVDMRKTLPETVQGTKVTSSNIAEAFNALREDGVVRFVRKDGNSRYYTRTGDEPSPELLERLGVEV